MPRDRSSSTTFVADLATNVALDRFGCFTAQTSGVSRSALSKQVRSGRIRRIHQGVYYAGSGVLTFEQRCAAALLAAGAGTAVTGLSAAYILRLWHRSVPRTIELLCNRKGRPLPGISVRRTDTWDPACEATIFCGLPLVACDRLIVELGQSLSHFQLTNVIKEAAFRGFLSPGEPGDTISQLSGLHGVPVARLALAHYQLGHAGTRSRLEDRVLRLIADNGLPPPDGAGVPVGPHEVDLIWFREHLIVEVDGPSHAQPNARLRDPERDADLARRGFSIERLGMNQIIQSPVRVIQSLARKLR